MDAFLKQLAKENERPARELTTEAMNSIMAGDWPGNVRELRTAIEHGIVMAKGPKITLRDLPESVRAERRATVDGKTAPAGGHLNLQESGHQLMMRALEETGGNVTAAAKKLGISRRTLHRKLRDLKPSP